jgi:NAD(P)-dependent dehydrogenase (short-subunit alcohol dehydrogenase family)
MNPVPDCGENSYRGSGRLTGKRAVITGGDSGIGRAVAIALAKAGADVVVNYVGSDEAGEQTVREIERSGRKAYAHNADVSQEAEVVGVPPAVGETPV